VAVLATDTLQPVYYTKVLAGGTYPYPYPYPYPCPYPYPEPYPYPYPYR